jgi:magnesium transporter
VIAAAMIINIATAGFAGVAIPVTLDRLDQDPAVASSVFVTMITDSMGFLAFLGLAVASGLVRSPAHAPTAAVPILAPCRSA